MLSSFWAIDGQHRAQLPADLDNDKLISWAVQHRLKRRLTLAQSGGKKYQITEDGLSILSYRMRLNATEGWILAHFAFKVEPNPRNGWQPFLFPISYYSCALLEASAQLHFHGNHLLPILFEPKSWKGLYFLEPDRVWIISDLEPKALYIELYFAISISSHEPIVCFMDA